MSTPKTLALIAVDCAFAVVGGIAAVAVHELLIPADVAVVPDFVTSILELVRSRGDAS